MYSIREKIIEAFDGVPTPDYDSLAPHHCDECLIVNEAFRNCRWNTLSSSIIEENFDKLSLLSHEGYHYFVPAFMLYALNSMNPKLDVLQFLIYSFSPSKDDFYNERFSIFSTAQLQVIVQFLVILKNNERFYEYSEYIDKGLMWFKNTF